MITKLCRWEHPFYPTYYFSQSDVSKKYFQNEKQGSSDSEKVYDLVVGQRSAPGAVTIFSGGDFKDLVKINVKAPDAWFEEDERIYSHPKDPYKVRCLIAPSQNDVAC